MNATRTTIAVVVVGQVVVQYLITSDPNPLPATIRFALGALAVGLTALLGLLKSWGDAGSDVPEAHG